MTSPFLSTYLQRGPSSAVPTDPPDSSDIIACLYFADDTQVLYAWNGLTWAPIADPGAGITELYGDVIAGPGSGSVQALLPASGVTAGTYTNTTLTVSATGLITDAVDGSSGSGAPAYQAGIASSRYYGTQIEGALSSTSISANTLHATPIYIGETTTFTRLACVINSAATAQAELGVYQNNDGAPGDLVIDAGAVTLNPGTGKREITGLSILLDPGWYWLTGAVSAAATMRTTPSNCTSLSNILGYNDNLLSVVPYIGATGSWTFSAGALPDPFPSPTLVTSNLMSVFIGL